LQLVHAILLTLSVVLLIWAFARWKGTPEFHPEYGVRRDSALLFILLVAAVIGDAARTRFPDVSMPFLLISLGLIPIAVGAVVLLVRLIKAYRQAQVAPLSNGEPHLSTRERRE